MLNEIQNQEIPKNVRAIASERKIDPNIIFQIIEDAVLKSLIHVYGNAKLSVHLDTDTGEIKIMECRKIIEDGRYRPENDIVYDEDNDDKESDQLDLEQSKPLFHYRLIKLSEAKLINREAKSGEMVEVEIPNAWNKISKTKSLIRTFNEDFASKLNTLIRQKEYEFFSERSGKIINAIVKRMTRDGYILSYDNHEILLPCDTNLKDQNTTLDQKKNSFFKGETILNERFGIDDSINVYIKSVTNDPNVRYQIIASRTHPMFLAELLRQNVPEVRDGQIIINKVVRIPGVRAKVVVHSTNISLDPVGACVGVRGARIKAISEELKGEKIDVIRYSSDANELIKNAIRPVNPIRITIDEQEEKIIVTVADKDLSNAIGRNGINPKLLSSLTNLRILMVSETIDAEQKLNEFKKCVELFITDLDVDEIIAQLLVVSGFKTVKSIVNNKNDLLKIEHFNEELVDELVMRAQEFLDKEYQTKIENLDKELIDFVSMNNFDKDMIIKIADSEVNSLRDLADLDVYELIEILGSNYSEDLAGDLIIEARKKVGDLV